jgi:hypothetical protein
MPPRQAGISCFGFGPKARCRLAYDLQLALDGMLPVHTCILPYRGASGNPHHANRGSHILRVN